MKKSIDTDIGVADAELVSYFRKQNSLIVKIKAWNEVVLTFTFGDFGGLSDYGLGDISQFVEEDEMTFLLERTLKNLYEKIPVESPYKIYQFLNLDDNVVLEIIATTVQVD